MPSVATLLGGLLLAGPAWTPSLPVAPRPAGAPARTPGTPTTLYLNYDGALLQSGCGNDPVDNCSTLGDLFNGYVGPFDGNEAQKMSILQVVRKRLAPFGVTVVLERPPPEVEYSMVLYGDLGPQSFAGIAPYIDCEDVFLRDTSFSQGFTSSNTGATIVLQEAAHTWGLEHVDSQIDVMNPFNVSGTTQVFQDECYPIVANTDLEPAPGICNSLHTKFCATGEQNSHQELLYLFGPGQPDIQAPTLDIVTPEDGAVFVAPVPSLPLAGLVTDNLHPQIYTTRIYDGADQLLFEGENGAISALLPLANLGDPPPGAYELRVEIVDPGGNSAEDRVRFTVLPEGEALPAPGEDAAALDARFEDRGGCRVAPRAPLAPGGALLWLPALALGSRRRP